jgi:hypothetical protein
VNRTLYVPYGGHSGDCLPYHGWVVGIPLDDPAAAPLAWRTRAKGGGIWGPAGVASDGVDAFVSTGNTYTDPPHAFGDGESLVRFKGGTLTVASTTADQYAPSNWLWMDMNDQDLAATAPILIDLEGATPTHYAVAFGKAGGIYLADRSRLGGVGREVAWRQVSPGPIRGVATSYRTPAGTYVALNAPGLLGALPDGCPLPHVVDLTVLKLVPGQPPQIQFAWCNVMTGMSGPVLTASDETGTGAVLWAVGAFEANDMHAFDPDTGRALLSHVVKLSDTAKYQSPIIAKGRMFVAANTQLWALTVH